MLKIEVTGAKTEQSTLSLTEKLPNCCINIKELNICMYGTKVILVSIAKFPICNNNSYRLTFLF